MVFSRTEHTPLLNEEAATSSSPSRFGARSVVRYVAGAAFVGLAVFAVVGSGAAPGVHVARFSLGDSSEGGSLAAANAARRSASAAAALTKQTYINAKTAKEQSDAVYAAAQAEAEKAERLAIQAAREFEASVGEDEDAADAATDGIQNLEDEALAEDATLTAETETYTSARAAYQESTDAIVDLEKALEAAKTAEAAAKSAHDEKAKIAAESKKAADVAHVAAEAANQKAQNEQAVGEEAPEAAIARAKSVADAAANAQAAQIKAAHEMEDAADALNALNAAKLTLKTATETLEAEKARNKVLAADSNASEQRMIEQSHITALAKTAAADAKVTSLTSYFNASATMSGKKDAADRAQEAADKANQIAKVRLAESRTAEKAMRKAADADDIAQAQVVLAERTVEVEEKKLQAMKNAEAAAEDAKTEGDLVSSDAVVDLEEDK